MTFATAHLDDIQKVNGGERYGTNVLSLSAIIFEDGLLAGRFAKLDTGSIDNMDASVTPVIAGIVLRKASAPVEDAAAIDAALFQQIEYGRRGLFTVNARAGTLPAKFGQVYAYNTGADAGLAEEVVTGGVIVPGCQFIEEIQAGVWLVELS